VGKKCVEVGKKKATISEELCIGCGICTKKCPFEAIKIIQLPCGIESETSHRYGANGFKLHRLPLPRLNHVLGIVGSNGTGKSTLLQILGGKLRPNLGEYDSPPAYEEIITRYRGSSLQNYFQGLYSGEMTSVLKPQYVDLIPKAFKKRKTVKELLSPRDERGILPELIKELELEYIWERDIHVLSGGELQRVAITATLCRKAQIYLFDEPSSFLDVRQRVMIAKTIRKWCCFPDTYTIVVEHDLSLLDYLSDYICFTYGEPSGYGVVTLPFGVGEGINVFLDGYNPKENMRFRPFALDFKLSFENDEELVTRFANEYPPLEKQLGEFRLRVEKGCFNCPEITVLLGENGAGKTTFLRLVADFLTKEKLSYKPQKISPKFEGTVSKLLMSKIPTSCVDATFITDVIRPLQIEHLYDRIVSQLSGGELQRVALVLALGKPADIYLIDEPSAYLDSEQRLAASKVIKKFLYSRQKSGFIVEHDIMMVNYLADRIIVFHKEGNLSTASAPAPVDQGMNTFLSELDITMRRDPGNLRPRINKADSQKDQKQRENKQYYV